MKYLFIFLLFLLTGCTPHLTVNVVKQPEINIKNKSISISSFKNDYINLSDKIKFSMPINNLKTFNSELSIEGFVYNPTYYDYQFIKKDRITEKIYTHDKQNNGNYKLVERIVNINCIRRTYTIDTSITIIENNSNNIIYNERIASSEDIEICENINFYNRHSNRYPSNIQYAINDKDIYDHISNEITRKFTNKFIENSFYESIEIIKEPISKNEILILNFKKGIESIKNKNLISAEITFKSIDDPAAYYNLGVINESKGNYFQALSFYEKAESIPMVKKSINRVKSTINAINNRTSLINN